MLLVAKETDVRATVHRDTLAMARNYERAARLKLVRVNMVRAGLEVKGAKTQGYSGPPFQDGGRGRSHGFAERFS
jgi:COP9 signalosome complex subunit 1